VKRTFLDRFIGFFSPEAELKRIRSKGRAELMLRSYDAAKTFSTDDWTSATKGSANSETRGAQNILREKGSDAVRNNPIATKAIMVISTNVVGSGIMPHIKGKTKLQTKRISDAWREWGETKACDLSGKNNFYGLQSLAIRSIAERGEVIALKEITNEGFKIQLVESDYIASNIDRGGANLNKVQDGTIQGLKIDATGKVISYFLYEQHPGEIITNINIREVPAEKVCHVYRQDRPGQLRGVSWFAPVLRLLEDLAQYQQATLIGRKVSACFTAFITTNDSDATLSTSDLQTKRQNENMMSPATISYLGQGESVILATPPKVDGYSEYVNQMQRAIAAGLGISYESLTGDYSQVNYSSGRMAHLEFKKNVEQWRWNVLIPQFCEPTFQHFLNWCLIVKGINTDGVSVDWVPPTWSMLDPGKEIAAMNDAMRSGLISYQKAVRELGYEPESMLGEIAENNKELDKFEIILDSDPRKTTKAGLFQIDNSQSQNGDNTSVQNSNEKAPGSGADPNSN
jgi:lambda family phage portal protein